MKHLKKHLLPSSLSLSLVSLLLSINHCRATGDNEYTIHDANEFVKFSNSINTVGDNYEGTTVCLGADIDFTEELSAQFNPIGANGKYFNGTFDGRGYTISNLNITSSASYVGLFGYLTGSTIRNVVLDSSCSVTSNYKGDRNFTSVGGIVGESKSDLRPSKIENCVNMATVTFSGNTTGNWLYVAGVVGKLTCSNFDGHLKNCANYGTVAYSGTSYNMYIGGIIGEISGSHASNYIQNCLNYGKVEVKGRISTWISIGGIAGQAYYTTIENCVHAGEISYAASTEPPSKYIGNIVGVIYHIAQIGYCYWTSESAYKSVYGEIRGVYAVSNSRCFSYDSSTFELSQTTYINNNTVNSLVHALNAFADRYSIFDNCSNWLLNRESKNVSFHVNNQTLSLMLNSQIILLPNPASEGSEYFDGWYNDNESTSRLEQFDIMSNVDVYGKLRENSNTYTITFDSRGGSPMQPISAAYLSLVNLPNNSKRDGCEFMWWETDYDNRMQPSLTMLAHDITLHAVWKCTHITTAEDLISLSKVVNHEEANYSGTTVFIDSDLDFAEDLSWRFEPIGNSNSYTFCGTFDAQGHTISNLKINYFSSFTGLFGCSNGLTIQNVVLDGTCSISNFYAGTYSSFNGGIIGRCNGNNSGCVIRNSVNMASITFSGEANKYMYIGGIVSCLHSETDQDFFYVKNCANYGSFEITSNSICNKSHIGGIVGEAWGVSVSKYIQNCFNYGNTEYRGRATDLLDIGGCLGWGERTQIENFVNGGKIHIESAHEPSYAGNILGYDAYSNTYINHCYWTNDTKHGACGNVEDDSIAPSNASKMTLNTTTVAELNKYASANNWAWWLFNPSSASVAFRVNNDRGFSTSSQLILLPDLFDNDACTFSGWYRDLWYYLPTSPSEVSEGAASTTFYSLYGVVITVAFSENGGNVSQSSKDLLYGSTYGSLPTPNRSGYMFTGWFNENGEVITNGTIVNTTKNHTLQAQWDEAFDCVEIVFGTKDLSNEEIERIVKQYTDAEFTILEVEDNDADKMVVIIKFNDIKDAVDFVRTVNSSSDNNFIRKVSFNPVNRKISFSATIGSALLLNMLI